MLCRTSCRNVCLPLILLAGWVATTAARGEVLATIPFNQNISWVGPGDRPSDISFLMAFYQVPVEMSSDLISLNHALPFTVLYDDSHPAFSAISALLTDDVDDRLSFFFHTWLPSGEKSNPLGGSTANESFWLAGQSDLAAMEITSIEHQVAVLNYSEVGSNRRVAFNSQWVIYGVPEPTTATYTAIGSFLVACGLWRKRARGRRCGQPGGN